MVLVLLWALFEMYPPTDRDLIETFRDNAGNRDTNVFSGIIQRALALQKQAPEKSYDNLAEAIGTNDITRFFPQYGEARDQKQPTTFILNQLQRKAGGRIKLGLDLRGGISILVQMKTNDLHSSSDIETARNEAVEVLRKRVDRLGVAEPLLQPEGSDRILVQLPGLSAENQKEAIILIKRAAFLEFRMVHENSDELVKRNEIEPGYEILRRKEMRNGHELMEVVEVKKKPEMVGGIKTAMVARGNMGEPQIHFTLDDDGAKRFGELTTQYKGRRMAIVLDGELYSAPVIHEPITSGSGQITGQFEQREAFELQNVLENPLRAPLEVMSSRSVDPTLGKEAIHSGVKACIYGVLAVSVFMLVYYMVSGLVANVALIANVIILLGVMCSVGTTLTLPGMAGIVLTVGMAVDANVLIYERIREELGKGKSLRGAIAAGYSRAFGTIFDSHVTTLISSIILIFMGTGSIKGFGVALTIGVSASLFTALIVTRMIFDWLLDRGWLTSVKMLHIIRATKLDFMKLAKPAFIMSWLLIAIGVGYGFHRGKGAFGVDFLGGDTIVFSYSQRVGEDQLRSTLAAAGLKDVKVQYQKDSDPFSKVRETLRVDSLPGTGSNVVSTLTGIPGAEFKPQDQQTVGPTVGQEIQKSALIASLLSLFGILVYVAFRYEFSFAVGAVLAVIHDVLMTIGWYCLSGRDFNATTVAAILTIIGFSTNDTIVIFDRIREDLKLGIRGTFKEVMNQALNQTLSRTIITSGTVFLATASLYFFGGRGDINDFAFTFLVGIITGTYSSIYIASALVLWWHKGQRPNIGGGVIATEAVEVATARSAS